MLAIFQAGPSLSWEIVPGIAVGASAHLVYSQMEMKMQPKDEKPKGGGESIDSNETYRIQFFALGSNLTAALTEVSTGDLVSLVSTVDGFYSSGVAGVLVETEYDGFDNPVAPIIGSFDEVQAVPEPSMAVLLSCGVGALALLGRRRMA